MVAFAAIVSIFVGHIVNIFVIAVARATFTEPMPWRAAGGSAEMDKIKIEDFLPMLADRANRFKQFYIEKLADKPDINEVCYIYRQEQTYDEWVEEMLIWEETESSNSEKQQGAQ